LSEKKSLFEKIKHECTLEGEPQLSNRDITAIESVVMSWLQERVNAIPDETWDQFQQRKGIISLIDELKE
jgi:hypothetical protein